MGNCISSDKAHYNHNGTIYRNYCKDCNMFISPNFTIEKHCCKCKKNYNAEHKHCCYCQQSYKDFHVCECKNCSLRSTSKKSITKNMQHTLCKNCNEQCSYNHICNNYIKKEKIMGIMVSEPISFKLEKGECNICFQKKEIKSLKCCNDTKYICKECYKNIDKCCPFCRKNLEIN